MNQAITTRREAKTAEKLFLQVLENDYEFPRRIAEEVLNEAQSLLQGTPGSMKVGQVRVILVARQAGHGHSLGETRKVEVVWTLDAGAEDREILAKRGRVGLRRYRLQRLLSEALEQGALASQEDVAAVLQVTPRTIQRDFAALKAAGEWLPARGNVGGIGRGQTHKAEIIRRWLQGETYDQLVLHTHHQLTSIQRYVQTFVRVVELERMGFPAAQIARLVQISEYLVREYLQVWSDNDSPPSRERLEEQLERFRQRVVVKKRGQP